MRGVLWWPVSQLSPQVCLRSPLSCAGGLECACDDWVTLALWVALTLVVLTKAASERVLRFVPLVAILAPLILVCAMAFVFRQNVPARGGLIFKQIEYHYYVTLRPLWKD